MNKKERREQARLEKAGKGQRNGNIEPVVERTASAEEADGKLADFAKAKRQQEASKPKPKAARKIAASAMPKLPRLPRKAKEKELHPCECGCPGGMTRSHFVPGHDGRPKGWMLRIDRGIIKLADVPDGERQVVERKLRERDGDGAVDALIAAEAEAEAENANDTAQNDEPAAEQDSIGDLDSAVNG